MRVIAGTARGIRLTAPKGMEVRPTLDRVRESLFNILAGQLENAYFLDLFAGTGANGIEAISRGSAFTTFVENDMKSIAAIERNLQATRFTEKAEIRRLTLPLGLRSLRSIRPYDIIFADPPYIFSDHQVLMNHIKDENLLAPQGIVILEHAAKTDLTVLSGPFSIFRQKRYGDSVLSFFS